MLKKIRPSIVFIPGIIFITVIILGFIFHGEFIRVLNEAFEWLMWNFGWMLSVGMLLFVAFMVFLLVHPIGNVRLGGKNAKPKLTFWQWFTVVLISGVGTGLVFWGPSPITYAMQPPPSMGLEPGSNDAIIWAMRTTFMHWTLTPYAIYVTFAVILAYVWHNLKKEAKVSQSFSLLIGKKAENKTFSAIIDTLTVFAIVGGIAGSLGFGILQLTSGLTSIFGVQVTNQPLTYTIIVAIITAIFTISAITGLKKGIVWLSDKEAWVVFFIMIFLLIVGPTAYIFNLMTQSVGSYLNNFVEGMTFTAPFNDGGLWPQWWDMFWWADWLSFGPIMGLFFARLGYGRTIKQFVFVNWLLPSAFGIFWFSAFGGTALHAQFFGDTNMYQLFLDQGREALTFATLDLVPLSNILRPLMFIIIALSCATLTDSMVSTVSSISLRNNDGVEEAPKSLKIFWGLLIGASALVFTLTGGISGIQMVKTFAGFPILFVGLAMLAGFMKYILTKAPRDNYGHYVENDAIKQEEEGI